MISFVNWTRTPRGWMVAVIASTLLVVATISCLSSEEPDPTATPTQSPAVSSPTPDATAEPTNTPPAPDPSVEPIETPTPLAGRRFTVDEVLVEMLGGDTTIARSFRDSFNLPASNLDESTLDEFAKGSSVFEEIWIRSDGLGPTFNANACTFCHINNGRGRPPEDERDRSQGLLLRFSVPTSDGLMVDPVYGGQLQDDAIDDLEPEGQIGVVYEEITGQFADGTEYTLLKPIYSVENLAYGPLHPDVLISPRIAPPMHGMGLLEAIPDETLLALADPEDADGDGISGRVNMVPDRRTGQIAIGRFGWKAGQPTVEQQAADAFVNDLGLTTSLYPVQDCPTNIECPDVPRVDDPEVNNDELGPLAFYNRVLAVPAMRDVDDPQVRRGAELFLSMSCSSCHIPILQTGVNDIAALSNQTIHPFTDLLLHDMGEGLADNRPEREADGREWRTAPLWGIGLTDTVSGHTRLLHDGRARNLTEAILWHGGEAEASRDLFKNLSASDRAALIAFLQAL